MDHYTLPWKFPESVPLSLRDVIGRPVRTVRPGEVITLEYIAGRVTFFLDEAGLVTEIGFEPEDSATRMA
ncbi:I78 family peptidase inhibitor [Massilia mucilaginosa]|nr:I78 family peptidase inhibitor [Massilia mucilaginosa]